MTNFGGLRCYDPKGPSYFLDTKVVPDIVRFSKVLRHASTCM